jgi:hypothetical protein
MAIASGKFSPPALNPLAPETGCPLEFKTVTVPSPLFTVEGLSAFGIQTLFWGSMAKPYDEWRP